MAATVQSGIRWRWGTSDRWKGQEEADHFPNDFSTKVYCVRMEWIIGTGHVTDFAPNLALEVTDRHVEPGSGLLALTHRATPRT